MDFVTICSDGAGRIWLALAADGTLWKSSERKAGEPSADSHWSPIAFNEIYAGYYMPCHFTALLATKEDFVAAGTGADGLPYVCRSLRGGVWDQVMLVGKTPMDGIVQARGRVNAMLFEPMTAQIFLLCDNGELVTLPDCPKCVRIRKVADQAILSGRICGKTLELTLLDQTVLKIGVSDVAQNRVSYSYAGKYLASHGGTIVWLGQGLPEFGQVAGAGMETGRTMGAFRTEGIRTICMVPEEVTDWLREELSRDGQERFVAFWCDYGVQADAAADQARSMGYEKAFSLGGEREYLHVV